MLATGAALSRRCCRSHRAGLTRIALTGESQPVRHRSTIRGLVGATTDARNHRYDFKDKAADYASLASELTALLAGETDLVANAANTSALLFDALPDINWAGFYFLRAASWSSARSRASPPACASPLGKGVCGTAAQQRETLVVPDVDAFPGHIACDAASRSEIVIPLLARRPCCWACSISTVRRPARFDDGDRVGLERVAAIFRRVMARAGLER